MNFLVLLLIFVLLVVADKGLTAFNISQVNKNFPEAMKEDQYKIEKNPLVRWFFNNFGLAWGTILYGFLSVVTLFIAYSFLRLGLNDRIALYVLMMLYALVIMNNFYFLLKYSRLIS